MLNVIQYIVGALLCIFLLSVIAVPAILSLSTFTAACVCVGYLVMVYIILHDMVYGPVVAYIKEF